MRKTQWNLALSNLVPAALILHRAFRPAFRKNFISVHGEDRWLKFDWYTDIIACTK